MTIEQTQLNAPPGHGVSADSAHQIRIPAPDELPVLNVDPERLAKRRIVGFQSRDIRSRSFNLLRHQIAKRLAQQEWRLLGVTSAAPEAGKSFICTNLAAALSRMPDQPVYLFDFDLRRGSIARELGLPRRPGLGSLLEGETTDLREIGCRVGEQGFAVFPCFPNFERSAELFATDIFAALVRGLRSLPTNAIVLCDLPPAFANDDTAVITQQLDAFLMIVEQGVTTKKQIIGTRELLQPIPCLGSVLNRYDGGWSDPYGYGYGYHDKYSKYYAA